MELVEVILQGVRGVPQQVRWTLPPGVAVLPANEREALVARAAFELLSGAEDGLLPAAALPRDQGGSQARAGVVVVGRDKRRFRVLWDLASGRRALQAQKGDAWETVTTTAREIDTALTATVGVPQRDALREIVFAFVDDLPSRRRTQAEASGPSRASTPSGPAARTAAALAPGFQGSAGKVEWADRPDAELRARLEELKRLAAANAALNALEFELSGLQKEAFDVDAQLKPLRDRAAHLDELRAGLAADAALTELPDDFVARLQSQRATEGSLGRALARIDDDERRVKESARDVPEALLGRRPKVAPVIVGEPLVRHGVLVGAAAIAIGLVGAVAYEPLRWFALLDIPAFAVAVFGGFRVLGQIEDAEIIRGLLERIAHERSREKERVAIERESLNRLMERAGFAAGDDEAAAYRVAAYRERQAEVQRAEGELKEAEQRASLVEHKARREELARRIRALEQKLEADGGAFDVQAGERQREQAEIESILRERADGPARAVDPAQTSSPSTPGLVPVDVGQIVARLASELLITSVDDACAKLAPRVSQLALALLGRRYTEVRFGARAEVSLVDAVTREAVPFTQLASADRDLALIALRLAVLEAVARRERVPLILDRSFDHLLPATMPLLTRALQFIGQQTQVLCVTARSELAGVGPAVNGVVIP